MMDMLVLLDMSPLSGFIIGGYLLGMFLLAVAAVVVAFVLVKKIVAHNKKKVEDDEEI